jgi:hypothetical protein
VNCCTGMAKLVAIMVVMDSFRGPLAWAARSMDSFSERLQIKGQSERDIEIRRMQPFHHFVSNYTPLFPTSPS